MMDEKSLAYARVHNWIKNERGNADHCEINKKHKTNYFDWANVSREYKYEIDDWIMLCRSCHRVFDNTKMTIEQLKENAKYRKVKLIEKEIVIQPFVPTLNDFMEKAKTEGIIYSRTYLDNGKKVQLRAYHE